MQSKKLNPPYHEELNRQLSDHEGKISSLQKTEADIKLFMEIFEDLPYLIAELLEKFNLFTEEISDILNSHREESEKEIQKVKLSLQEASSGIEETVKKLKSFKR